METDNYRFPTLVTVAGRCYSTGNRCNSARRNGMHNIMEGIHYENMIVLNKEYTRNTLVSEVNNNYSTEKPSIGNNLRNHDALARV